MKQFDTPVLDSPLMDAFAPSTLTPAGGESSSGEQDWDWHEACRVAALLGFDTEARQARRRGLRSRSETPWQPSAALTGSQRAKWSSQEAGIVDHLSQGNWYQLVTALEDAMKARHPFEMATFQQLHFLACVLAGVERAALPEQDREEGGSFIQALYDLCKLVQIAPDEDLEWAFEQGLSEISPYLMGDRPALVRLLYGVEVPAARTVERVVQGLGQSLGLAERVGPRYAATRLYFELSQRPPALVTREDFLQLQALAGDQAFFHSFLGRQQLVHWRLDRQSIRHGFEHLWRAYQQECEFAEEPRIEFTWLGNEALDIAEDTELRVALQDGLAYLAQTLKPSLATSRFLRHLWRHFLCRYQAQLGALEQAECLTALLQIREALADEADAALEFAIADLSARLKQWQHVERGYLQGLRLEPDNIEAIQKLAAFYQGRSRYQEAQALLSKALRHKPGDGALVNSLQVVSGRLDVQHQRSPFLTHNPEGTPRPFCILESLDDSLLLALAALVTGLRLDDSGQLRAFGDVEHKIFTSRFLRDSVMRELLERGAVLIYRYSPEQSYRIRGEVFDYDCERVEWVLNVQSETYPEMAAEAAAVELLWDRLNREPTRVNSLWRQVAVHDLLEHAQHRFEQQRWSLDVTDYLYEVIGSLLETLSLQRAMDLVDQAVAATAEEQAVAGQGRRQLSQIAIRNLHACYERAIFSDQDWEAGGQEPPQLDSLWSTLFRGRVTKLGALYYQAVPGAVEFARHTAMSTVH